jgi:hypothetical protein
MQQEISWAEQIRLDGAGMPEVDGLYSRQTEDFCGVPQWKHVEKEMWIFWGGDFEGYWVIGHSHYSGDGYRYTHPPRFTDQQESWTTVEKLPLPPTSENWGVYITGYNPGEGFLGGINPAPSVFMMY